MSAGRELRPSLVFVTMTVARQLGDELRRSQQSARVPVITTTASPGFPLVSSNRAFVPADSCESPDREARQPIGRQPTFHRTLVDRGPESRHEHRAARCLCLHRSCRAIHRNSRKSTGSLYDPLGVRVDADQTTATNLIDTGRYLLLLEAGLTPPASVKIFPVDPAALVLPATVGQPITFDLQEPRAQYARLSLGGGRRYRLVVPSGQKATVCVTEFEGGSLRNQRCVPSPSPLSNQAAAALIFVMRSDLDVQVRASADNPYDGVPVTTVSARIEEMASDVLPHQLRRRSSTSSRKKGRA